MTPFHLPPIPPPPSALTDVSGCQLTEWPLCDPAVAVVSATLRRLKEVVTPDWLVSNILLDRSSNTTRHTGLVWASRRRAWLAHSTPLHTTHCSGLLGLVVGHDRPSSSRFGGLDLNSLLTSSRPKYHDPSSPPTCPYFGRMYNKQDTEGGGRGGPALVFTCDLFCKNSLCVFVAFVCWIA